MRGRHGTSRRTRNRIWVTRILLAALVATGFVAVGSPAHAIATRTVAYYSMDEPAGATQLRDSSGNGRHGTIGSDVTTGVLYQGATAHRYATHLPSAGAFPGHTDNVPHSTEFNPDAGDFSIELRIRTTYSFGNIMQKGQGGATGGYWKLESPGGLPRCLFRGGNGASRTGYSNVDISDGQWHTIRCNRTSSYVEMWVDGVRQSRLNGSTGNIANGTALSIGGKRSCDGQTVTCDYFIGDIDYIRIEKGAGSGTNAPPVPVPSADCVGLVCALSGAGSTDADGAIQRYRWDFGDGQTFDGASVPTTLHTYASAGTYTVTLSVTDDRGSTVSGQRQVSVAPAAETIGFVGQATSNVNSSTHQVTVPSAVQPGDTMLLFFSQNTQTARTGPSGVTGWTQLDSIAGGSARTTVWSKVAEAGDSGSPTRVTLATSAKGNMVLAAYRGAAGVSAFGSRTDPASSAVRLTPTVPVATNRSWAVSYWMHGDAATSTLVPPSGVTVRSNGSQTGGGRVTGLLADSGAMVPTLPYGGLSATAAAASTTNTTWTLVLSPAPDAPVDQPPVADLAVSCTLLDCVFDGSGSSDAEGAVVSYLWDFGDGATASGSSPTVAHSYAAAGVFSATLTVTDSAGLSASAAASVSVSTGDPEPALIDYVGSASSSRTSTSHTVVVPTSVQAGDALLLFLGIASRATIADPAGWQALGTQDGGDLRTRVWFKVAAASDAGATVTVPLGASVKGNLMVSAHRGARASLPVFAAAAGAGNTGTRTTPTAPVSVAGSWAISYWAHRDSASTVLVPVATVQGRTSGTQTGGGRVTTLLADSAGTVAVGSYGAVTATAESPSTHGAAWTVILAPE